MNINEEKNKKIAFYTLGCKLNFSESSSLSQEFKNAGYDCVAFEDKADIFVINTCSVTENADKKCKKIVEEAKKRSPQSYIALIGCYAQLQPETLAKIYGVNLVLGAKEKFSLLKHIETSFDNLESKHQPKPIILHEALEKDLPFHSSFSLGDRTRTFLKVQDGCNYNCSFCTIPLARGKSRSPSIEKIEYEVKKLVELGIKEIVLTGVNIGDYGILSGKREQKFIDLLKVLDNIKGISRFRISSIEPNLLTDEIIDFVAYSESFVPHFHIPLQSGHDGVLKDMRRRYDSKLYINRIKKITQLMPRASIGIDVIVGFPTETEDYFQETYHFLTSLPCAYLHVFTYSERPNTPAFNLPQIPYRDRKIRAHKLRELSKQKKTNFYRTYLNQKALVLFEKENKNGKMLGFTDNYIRVSSNYNSNLTNQIVEVQLEGLLNQDMVSSRVLSEIIPES